MALQFPTNPVDGQQVTLNGKVWRYDATQGLWSVPTVSSTQSVALARTELTATAGQTVLNATYNPNYGVNLTINGLQMLSSDFTATDGSTITLTEALAEGDEVTVMAATGVPESALRSIQLSVPGPLTLKTGTARWYAPQAMTIVSTIGRLGTAADDVVTVIVNKNGSPAVTLEIPAGQTKLNSNTEFSLTDEDYLTVDITTIGTTGAELHLTINYKLI